MYFCAALRLRLAQQSLPPVDSRVRLAVSYARSDPAGDRSAGEACIRQARSIIDNRAGQLAKVVRSFGFLSSCPTGLLTLSLLREEKRLGVSVVIRAAEVVNRVQRLSQLGSCVLSFSGLVTPISSSQWRETGAGLSLGERGGFPQPVSPRFARWPR